MQQFPPQHSQSHPPPPWYVPQPQRPPPPQGHPPPYGFPLQHPMGPPMGFGWFPGPPHGSPFTPFPPFSPFPPFLPPQPQPFLPPQPQPFVPPPQPLPQPPPPIPTPVPQTTTTTTTTTDSGKKKRKLEVLEDSSGQIQIKGRPKFTGTTRGDRHLRLKHKVDHPEQPFPDTQSFKDAGLDRAHTRDYKGIRRNVQKWANTTDPNREAQLEGRLHRLYGAHDSGRTSDPVIGKQLEDYSRRHHDVLKQKLARARTAKQTRGPAFRSHVKDVLTHANSAPPNLRVGHAKTNQFTKAHRDVHMLSGRLSPNIDETLDDSDDSDAEGALEVAKGEYTTSTSRTPGTGNLMTVSVSSLGPREKYALTRDPSDRPPKRQKPGPQGPTPSSTTQQ